MNLHGLIKPWRMALLVTGLLLCATAARAAVPAAWKDSGFSINAGGMTVKGVLEEFSRTYNVRLSMSADGDRLAKGRLKADNGIEFLNRLAGTYKFRWFVYNDTLYVTSAGDNTSLRLEVGEDAVQDAKAALIGLGLFDDRFGWGELPDEGVVIVGGPRSYVDLARDILLPPAEKKFARKGKQIMMFRLKYASAMDRTITARGKTETIPGIKTILGNLLFGPSTGEKLTAAGPRFSADSSKRSRLPKNERDQTREAAGGTPAPGGVFAPLFAAPGANGKNPLLPGGDAGGAPSALPPALPSQQRGNDDDGRPRIEADPTLNAIMIYDNINKKDMYAALIADLDVQPQQIEIEALIIDIDRGKLSDMGVEWGIRAGAVTTTMNATTAASQGQELPLPGATLLISNVARFYARLKAMESNGDARVLATPTVLTLDNVAAVLDLSRSAYVSLVGERVADMADITAGTMLRVIPRIIHDGGQTRVRLEVDIEDGSLDSQDNSATAGGNGTGTISTGVTRSSISTQAIIDTQQTLMIGGYRAESLSKNKQKVPVLGDLPWLGGLFRSESQSNSTRERLFLITPRIAGTDGADMSTKNALKARTGAAPDAARTEAPPPPVAPAAPAAAVAATGPTAPAAAANAGGAPSLVVVPGPDILTSLGDGLRTPVRVKAACKRKAAGVRVL